MSEESELKRKGEKLAQVAVKGGLGKSQLRDVYDRARAKPLPFVEAFIKYQMHRVPGREAWEMMLDLLKEFGDNATPTTRVLMYANMLHAYYEGEVIRTAAERSSKKICQQQHCTYVRSEVLMERNRYKVNVKVSGFRGDPKSLAFPITREIIHEYPSFRGDVWIDVVDGR